MEDVSGSCTLYKLELKLERLGLGMYCMEEDTYEAVVFQRPGGSDGDLRRVSSFFSHRYGPYRDKSTGNESHQRYKREPMPPGLYDRSEKTSFYPFITVLHVIHNCGISYPIRAHRTLPQKLLQFTSLFLAPFTVIISF
jgi:hypothetical protein